MSKAIAFLNNKGFHPGNMQNRRRVWIAEQKAEEQKKAAEERRKTLQEERSKMEQKSLLGVSVDEQQLAFMYQAPAGLEEIQRREREEMLAQQQDMQSDASRGEKKGFYDKAAIVAEHPALKDAPVVDKYAKNLGVNINAKPLGLQVRRVRCLRCGQVGHLSGERECPMKDQNPNEEFHRMVEDPMQAILAMRQQQQQQDHGMQGSLQLKAHIRRDLNFIEAPSSLTAMPAEKPTPSPQVITNEEEYLATLSRKDKKRLLKHLLEQEERGAKEVTASDLVAFMQASKAKDKKDKKKKDKSKRDKKSKKRKRRDSSSSSDSGSESDSSQSDSDGDSRGEDRKSRRDKRKSSSSSKSRHHYRSNKRRRSRSRSRSRSRDRERDHDRKKDRRDSEKPASSSSKHVSSAEIAPSITPAGEAHAEAPNRPDSS
eukprot:TRINITY_DN965_c0_g4_i1.p1 TRINITY_DN965_c0_g4~~TRINITY_DN965_c0_g4_i1.p1  ORF type:complete len:428 (-),score=107.16 TRINITY_DN965_c0_g4_i1:47-1330(-)